MSISKSNNLKIILKKIKMAVIKNLKNINAYKMH